MYIFINTWRIGPLLSRRSYVFHPVDVSMLTWDLHLRFFCVYFYTNGFLIIFIHHHMVANSNNSNIIIIKIIVIKNEVE